MPPNPKRLLSSAAWRLAFAAGLLVLLASLMFAAAALLAYLMAL
jgi:hypothetical protein